MVGGFLGIYGIYIRSTSQETEAFEKKEHHAKPLKIILSDYNKELKLGVIFTSILAIGNYTLIAFISSYLVKYEALV